jgi:hypothetical protein
MDMDIAMSDTSVSQLPSLCNNYPGALVISTTICGKQYQFLAQRRLLIHVLGIYVPIVAITLDRYLKNRKQRTAQRLILVYSLVMDLLTIGSFFTTTISMEALLVEVPTGHLAVANAANLMAAPGSSMTSMCTPTNTVANIISHSSISPRRCSHGTSSYSFT